MSDYQISENSTDLMRDDSSYHVQENKGRKMQVASLGLLLLMAVAPTDGFSAQSNVSVFDSHDSQQVVGHKVNMEQKCLTVPVCKNIREKSNYDRLLRTFSRHFSSSNVDSSYLTTFDEVANVVKSLYIDKLYVDINRRKGLVDFTLNLGNHIVLSIGKKINESSVLVMFTLSYKGELLVADVMSLTDLLSKISNIQTSLLKEV